ncbi:MAG: carboxypeptidase regulatory-like domain-containing protein [Gemmatimonadetes bacterium]|nr:carboxypeptidase regulatory-like domain-containing protein [Gemmatimonadota bacterium]
MALLGAGRLAAQSTTGKIEGTVRDQAGAPVVGAQVLVVGSAFTASTNEQGYYFINNVPAGVMAIRAQYIGYAPAEVRNVRVFAEQTMTVNLTLEARAVEVTGITVTVEANPIVPRDQVTSKPIVQGDLIDQLPADDISQVLRLQPGVVEGTRGLVIRGGRPGEAAVYVDGVQIRNLSSGFGVSTGNAGGVSEARTVTVGTNALEEASVTTGAIGVEFGDAQSGVISMVTRAGGSDFRGTLSYSTDELSGETYGQGLHRVEASIGGPIARNLTFFLGTTLAGQQNIRQPKGAEDVPIYVQNGFDTSNPEAPNGTVTVPKDPGNPASDSAVVSIPAFTRYSQGSRRPDAWSDALTMNGKLQYSFGTGSRASITYLASRDQSLVQPFFGLYNPQARSGQRQTSRALILNYTQNLARSSERALFLEANASWQRDDFISGALDPSWFEDNREPFGWFSTSSMEFLVNRDNFPIDDQLITNVRLGGAVCQSTRQTSAGTVGACIPFVGRQDLLATTALYRQNPYGVNSGVGFTDRGYADVNPVLARESRLTARVNLDWQADRYNRVRFGGDWLRATEDAWTSDMNEFFGLDAYRNTPSRFGLFANNRLDLGDLVIEVGLRYDRFNPDLLFARAFPRTFNDPLRQGDLSVAYTAADTAMGQRCGQLFTLVSGGTATAADSVALSTCNMVEAPTRSRLSPSLRVSFPVTDRTGFRLSYSHQVQQPDFNRMAQRANGDASYYNTNATYGSPLRYGRSILFEFGIRHAFSDDLVLDIAAYNKDKVSDLAARIVGFNDVFQGRLINYNVMTNEDFGNSRGVDIKLDARSGSLFAGSLSYTFQRAGSTGSDPFEYLGTTSRQISTVTQDRTPPAQALLPTRDDRTHTIAGSGSLSLPHGWRSGDWYGSLLQDFGFFATFRFASGLPYTKMINDGNGQQAPGNAFGLGGFAAEPLNASRTPWIKNVDLRVTRGFRLGGDRDVTAFADFRNLFNFTNIAGLFAETGDVRNERYQTEQLTDIFTTLRNDAGGLVQADGSIDLTDCSAYPYGPNGSKGVPDCLLLRGAERRYATGTPDGIFSADEQQRAFDAYYNGWSGPQIFKGPGFNMRIGFELHF